VRGFYKDCNIVFEMRGKRGTTGLLTGRMIIFVVAIVVLFVVSIGWMSGSSDWVNAIKGKTNEVLILLHIKDVGDGVGDCYTGNIDEFKGGDKLIVKLDGGGEMKVCRGYCEVELEDEIFSRYVGFNSKYFKYETKGGGIMTYKGMGEEGGWSIPNHDYLGLGVEKMETYKDVHFKIKGKLLDDVFGGDLDELKSFMRFNPENVLEFRWTQKVGSESVSRVVFFDGVDWKKRMDRFDAITFKDENKNGAIVTAEDLAKNFIWEGYIKNVVSWGYEGKENIGGVIERGKYSKEQLRNLIGAYVGSWNSKFEAYNKGIEGIKGFDVDVIGGESPLRLRITEEDIFIEDFSGEDVTFVFVTLDSGRVVGVYYDAGFNYGDGIRFYPVKDKTEYDMTINVLDDEEWANLIMANRLYEFFEEGCDG